MTSQSGQQRQSEQARFFAFFQDEVTELQERMRVLENQSTAGGERNDAVDHCLAGIANLSNEVKDASSYLPSYDQRTYSEAIKALSEKLVKVRSSFAPRQKFSFKSSLQPKNASAISLNDAAEMAARRRPRPVDSSNDSSMAPTPAEPATPLSDDDTMTAAMGTAFDGNSMAASTAKLGGIRKPSFSAASSITISNHSGIHIILPEAASHATSSGTLSNLRRCVVDISMPTATGRPFAALYLKNIKDSLVICGHVNGAAHITNVTNSIIVVAARQFRMHESSKCDVYLHCASRPIIEACHGVRFARLPDCYMTPADRERENQYDQVDDFKWLQAEHSPNWSVLDDAHVLKDEIWRNVVPGAPGIGLSEIMRAVKLPQL